MINHGGQAVSLPVVQLVRNRIDCSMVTFSPSVDDGNPVLPYLPISA